MLLRPLIAVVVGAGLFTALALYAPPLMLEAEGPLDFRLMLLIGSGGSLAAGAIVVFIAGHRRWWWLGGLLSPLAGSILCLGVFVSYNGSEQTGGADLLSVLAFTYVPFVPTAIVGATVAAYVLERRARFGSPSVSPGSSEERAG